MREVVVMHESDKVPDPFSSEDVKAIKSRLKALGYL
jgi:hypothetical protein